MASKRYMLLGVVLFGQLTPVVVMGEGRCFPGQYPIGDQGVGGCALIPSATGQGAAQPTGHWVTTWGAIAKDEKPTRDTNLAIGVVESVATKEEASRIALSRCVQTGGNDC